MIEYKDVTPWLDIRMLYGDVSLIEYKDVVFGDSPLIEYKDVIWLNMRMLYDTGEPAEYKDVIWQGGIGDFPLIEYKDVIWLESSSSLLLSSLELSDTQVYEPCY